MDPIARRFRCRPARRATHRRRTRGRCDTRQALGDDRGPRARRIRHGVPTAPRLPGRAACRCRPPWPTGCGRSRTSRRVDRCLPALPMSCTARTTSSRLPRRRGWCRCTTAGSCVTRRWPTARFVRAGRVLRRAVGAWATVHASRRRPTADAAPTCFRTLACAAIPLAAMPLRRRRPAPPIAELVGSPYVLAIGTLERRKNLPRSGRGVRTAGSPSATEVCAGARRRADGDDRPAIDEAIDRLGPAVAGRVVLTGRVDDASALVAAAPRAGARLPVARRGVRIPPARRDAGGRADRRPAPSAAIPEVAGGQRRLLCDRGDVGCARRQPCRSGLRRPTYGPVCLTAAGEQLAHVLVATSRDGPCRRCIAGSPPRHASMIAVLCGGVGAARFLRSTGARRRSCRRGRDRQHRRRHRAARSVDLARPRHDRLHAGRCDRPRTRAGDWSTRSWRAMEALQRYAVVRPVGSTAAPTWFNLGDRDLATHFYRTADSREGATLADVTAEIRAAWGVTAATGADERRPGLDPGRPSPTATTSRSRSTSSSSATALPVTSVHVRRRVAGRACSPDCGDVLDAADVRRDRAVEPDRVDRTDPGAARRRRPCSPHGANRSSPSRRS